MEVGARVSSLMAAHRECGQRGRAEDSTASLCQCKPCTRLRDGKDELSTCPEKKLKVREQGGET